MCTPLQVVCSTFQVCCTVDEVDKLKVYPLPFRRAEHLKVCNVCSTFQVCCTVVEVDKLKIYPLPFRCAEHLKVCKVCSTFQVCCTIGGGSWTKPRRHTGRHSSWTPTTQAHWRTSTCCRKGAKSLDAARFLAMQKGHIASTLEVT